jgi:hypothetical protein
MKLISTRKEPSENIFSVLVDDIEFSKYIDSDLREFKKVVAMKLVDKVVEEFFERNRVEFETIIKSEEFRDLMLNHLASIVAHKFLKE